MGWLTLLVLLSRLVIFTCPKEIFPSDNDYNYRAALYSFHVDFSAVAKFEPEMYHLHPTLEATAYVYYIQYGQDTLIEILDSGHEMKFVPNIIIVSDHINKKSTSVSVMDRDRKYFRNDISYNSVGGRQGSVENLCEGIDNNQECDSLIITLDSTGTQYKLFFNDTIANLRCDKLFSPDIKYLPYKICRLNRPHTIFHLEKTWVGKSEIDALIDTYKYTGYKEFVVDKLSPTYRQCYQYVRELNEKMKNR